MKRAFFARPETATQTAVAAASAARRRGLPPLFFFGMLFGLAGLALYLAGILFAVLRLMLRFGDTAQFWNETIIWCSGVLCTAGLMSAALDLVLLLPTKRKESRRKVFESVLDRTAVVALTAYDDEQSIADAVTDFTSHPSVRQVLVVDNHSQDRTFDRAARAGARVVTETKPGYGQCVYRCIQEALADPQAALIVLCEGDMTFRAKDLDKLRRLRQVPVYHSGLFEVQNVVQDVAVTVACLVQNEQIGRVQYQKHEAHHAPGDQDSANCAVKDCLMRPRPGNRTAVPPALRGHAIVRRTLTNNRKGWTEAVAESRRR